MFGCGFDAVAADLAGVDLGVRGSGSSVEPPKLNVKTYNKLVVKKEVNQLS